MAQSIILGAQMVNEWRDWVYPIGFLASFVFMARFAIQWMISEKKQKSVVTRSFWQISLFANFLMITHSLLQIQYSICIVQACNAVISWRNLNFMQDKSQQATFRTVLFLLAGAITLVTTLFVLQGYWFFEGDIPFARRPTFFYGDKPADHLPLGWHLLGFLGISLFASRFWVQWWLAEKEQSSSLGEPFWWLSITGAILSVIYFIPMYDLVNILGPGLGLVPYVRNLILLKRDKIFVKANETA